MLSNFVKPITTINMIDLDGTVITGTIITMVSYDGCLNLYTINYTNGGKTYISDIVYDGSMCHSDYLPIIANKLTHMGYIMTGSHMEGEPDDGYRVPEYDMDLYIDQDGMYYAVNVIPTGPNKAICIEAIALDDLDSVIRDAVIFNDYLPIIFGETDDDLPF